MHFTSREGSQSGYYTSGSFPVVVVFSVYSPFVSTIIVNSISMKHHRAITGFATCVEFCYFHTELPRTACIVWMQSLSFGRGWSRFSFLSLLGGISFHDNSGPGHCSGQMGAPCLQPAIRSILAWKWLGHFCIYFLLKYPVWASKMTQWIRALLSSLTTCGPQDPLGERREQSLENCSLSSTLVAVACALSNTNK